MLTMYPSIIEETKPGGDTLAPPCHQLTGVPDRRVHFRVKAVVDRLLALVLLVPALPLISLLIVLIRLNSRGPGVFRQKRLGKDGREYVMFKLRSMRVDAEVRTGAVWSSANDPRVTPLGRFLRKSHLDELPQLFNVLRGEMSLIGPRPERPEIVRVLEGEIPGYLNRLAVLPGITGLAQINLPPDTDLYSVRCKLALDLQYIAEANLFFDLRILLCTLLRLVGCSGDRSIRLTRLQRQAELPPGVNGHRTHLGLLCPADAGEGQAAGPRKTNLLATPSPQPEVEAAAARRAALWEAAGGRKANGQGMGGIVPESASRDTIHGSFLADTAERAIRKKPK